MKTIISLLFCSCFAILCCAQELRWEFVNAADFIEGENVSLNWTIGESYTTEVTGPTASLRVGFLPFSSAEDITSSVRSMDKNINISVWPNPASDQLNIETNTDNMYVVKIYGANGAELISTQFQESKALNITSLPIGTYSILLIDTNGTFNSTTFVKA